jgi:broad specificity phosphatase PhoE
MSNPTFYLTNRAGPDGVLLSLLPQSELQRDTVDSTLVDAGWRYAEFQNTGHRVLVRSKHYPEFNRRWLAAWSECVTDFEVREVDTVARGGAIVADLGAFRNLKLYGLADKVWEDYTGKPSPWA